MKILYQYTFIFLSVIFTKVEAQKISTKDKRDYYTDQWEVTDALGRSLPTYDEVGPIRKDKIVGVFYYVWQGFHGKEVFDITKILKKPEKDRKWGKPGDFHFWGEPEQGFYQAKDPWVLRRDLQMLTNAKVDFIFLDVTNAVIYPDEVQALYKMGAQMRSEGIATPTISFCTNAKSGNTINAIYDAYYSKKEFADQWFMWDGKPLILGHETDPELRPEVKNFFTIKFSWAWTATKTEPNHWQWLDTYPQDYGWKINPSIPEQISVSVAHHPMNPLGKSYHDGQQPPVNADYLTAFTDQGLQFAEQWKRALEVDPQVVMVTQWNEWIAQRFIWEKGPGNYGGRPIDNGDSWFVDVFTEEFNRDIAPMKDGYSDNYYYQLIANIRKYKGMEKPQKFFQPNPITIDGNFEDWIAVTPNFKDPIGDVMHRNFSGYDPKVHFVNATGRNDILNLKVGLDIENIYFYAETAKTLSSSTDSQWMLLFIDVDKNIKTGWEGYDYVINRKIKNKYLTTIQKWDGKKWGKSVAINYRTKANQLEIAIPLSHLNLNNKKVDFYFKWTDNPGKLKNISTFFMNGDAAPDRRFKYHFKIE